MYGIVIGDPNTVWLLQGPAGPRRLPSVFQGIFIPRYVHGIPKYFPDMNKEVESL